MSKITPILYLVFAVLLGLIALASLIDLIRALLVPHTLTAVETALGTAVLIIVLAVMATKLFKIGRHRLQQAKADQTENSHD